MPYRFVENASAPEVFCDHLHDVQFINGIARFVPISLKRSGAEFIGEPQLTILMPTEAVKAALELTYQRMPNGIIIPALGKMVRRALMPN
jgi:hypothetical protein